MELLTGAADAGSSVTVEELRVAFDGERTDEVELALRDFDDGFFGAIAEEKLADCNKMVLAAGGAKWNQEATCGSLVPRDAMRCKQTCGEGRGLYVPFRIINMAAAIVGEC